MRVWKSVNNDLIDKNGMEERQALQVFLCLYELWWDTEKDW